MTRSAFAVPAVVLASSLVVWAAVAPPGEEKSVRGTVVAARAEHCEPKKAQGCSGTMTLARGDRRLTITIPEGTPITAGCSTLSFRELPGRRVTVTEVKKVAKAIAAADVPAC